MPLAQAYRCFAFSLRWVRPSKRISPPDGASRPAISFATVDLPQPDSPTNLTTSLLPSVNETSVTTRAILRRRLGSAPASRPRPASKVFEIFLSSSTGLPLTEQSPCGSSRTPKSGGHIAPSRLDFRSASTPEGPRMRTSHASTATETCTLLRRHSPAPPFPEFAAISAPGGYGTAENQAIRAYTDGKGSAAAGRRDQPRRSDPRT